MIIGTHSWKIILEIIGQAPVMTRNSSVILSQNMDSVSCLNILEIIVPCKVMTPSS